MMSLGLYLTLMKLKFTPLEFETLTCLNLNLNMLLLKFTPLEFET